MIIAVLDLGTNTFHLFIAELISGKTNTVFKDRIPVKLLEGSASDNRIQQAPFQRGIQAMKTFYENIQKYKVEKIVAYATSAIRSALNGKEFHDQIKAETGIEVQIISGDQEAEFIYYGVKQSLTIGTEASLILDIGGGSNEFVICNDQKILWKHSFNLGAARLLEMFKPSDPITTQQISALENYFEKELALLFDALKLYPVNTLIGCSGSFDTFAEMISYRFPNVTFVKGQKEFEFDLGHVNFIHSMILNSTFEERMHMKGLVEMRVDMIVIASIFTKFVIDRCGIRRLRLSKGALKEGMMWHEIQYLRS